MEANHQKSYDLFVGIDVSKLTLDVGLVDSSGKKTGHRRFKNNLFGFESLLEWMNSHCKGEAVVCLEHTGLYSRKIQFFLQDQGIDVCMESGYVIKRSSGIVKGKSDKLDSYRIAEYALSRRYKLKITPHYDAAITLLHDLLTTRKRLMTDLKRVTTPIHELKAHADQATYQQIAQSCQPAIDGLKKAIKAINKQIESLVEEQQEWQENIRLGRSVKGIGKVVCLWMLVYTANFKTTMNARRFASLVGIAPFEESSGISIRKGAHVSHHAHKFMKGILHASAMTAIANCPKIKAYHAKKKSEGKKGFVVMNNIKNKLVQTVFAVIRSRQEYDQHFVHKRAA
jgi:transposase